LDDESVVAGSGILLPIGNAASSRAAPDAPTTILIVTLLPADTAPSLATPAG
jgi:hypothetical protein